MSWKQKQGGGGGAREKKLLFGNLWIQQIERVTVIPQYVTANPLSPVQRMSRVSGNQLCWFLLLRVLLLKHIFTIGAAVFCWDTLVTLHYEK